MRLAHRDVQHHNYRHIIGTKVHQIWHHRCSHHKQFLLNILCLTVVIALYWWGLHTAMYRSTVTATVTLFICLFYYFFYLILSFFTYFIYRFHFHYCLHLFLWIFCTPFYIFTCSFVFSFSFLFFSLVCLFLVFICLQGSCRWMRRRPLLTLGITHKRTPGSEQVKSKTSTLEYFFLKPQDWYELSPMKNCPTTNVIDRLRHGY